MEQRDMRCECEGTRCGVIYMFKLMFIPTVTRLNLHFIPKLHACPLTWTSLLFFEGGVLIVLIREVHLGLYVVPTLKEYYPIFRVNIIIETLTRFTLKLRYCLLLITKSRSLTYRE